MGVEVTSLSLNVKSDSVATGAKRLDHLTKSSGKASKSQRTLTTATGKSSASMGKNATATGTAAASTAGLATAQTGATATTNGLGVALKSALGPILALLGPVLLLKKAFTSTVELQDFQAQLKTATGSVEDAAVAFEALEDFASETPYALEQSLEAFIKLTNLGLTPSERALRSYGNTASAMGKDMMQLIEAVADASTGEFERLKEFGIKAKSEGDKVSFTFRGVTETVGKNAAEIEGYLMALGENEFGSAMSDRMATVGGQVSNLGDLWNKLFRTVSEMGVGSAIGESLQFGIGMLDEFIAILESGQFEAELDSWTTAFDGWAEDFEGTLDLLGDMIGIASQDWADTTGNGWKEILDMFKLLPAQIRAWVRRVGVEISAIALYGEAAGRAIVIAFVAQFKGLVETAKNFGKTIGHALNPFDDTDFMDSFKAGMDRQAQISIETGKKIVAAYTEAEKQISAVRKARLESIKEVEADFNATVDRVDTLTKKSKDLRSAYDAERAAKKKAREDGTAEDKLNRFKITPTKSTAPFDPSVKATNWLLPFDSTEPTTETGQKATAAKATSDEIAFRKLVDDLATEEEMIETSYQKRIEIIRRNTEEGSKLRTDLEVKATEDRNAELKALEQKRYDTAFALADDYFSNFAGLAESSNKDLSRVGRAALEVQKGLAIAQTIMKTQEAAMSAYSALAGTPYVGPALGAAAAAGVVAAGAARVATISSAGSYATGGIVPGSSYNGDAMQANVNSAEMILTQQQQARLFSMANGGGNSSSSNAGNILLNVSVENYGSSEITVDRISANDVRVIARDVVREEAPAVVAADLGDPNSRTSNAISRNTTSQRRRG